tara:strand:- start:206 stop:367 length:162 start_codon:yes stop_codon:yes gene_type:complete
MNPQLDSIIGRLQSLETVDWEREAELQGFYIVQLGEEFKDEMIDLIKTRDENH